MPPNRLSREKSPYLLQHADNPVEWYPWGEEAFARAAVDDKPIFLSIGYSTCHWCHVMAHESFEDREVAALMNETFVNVKVDREERPDVDHVYMTVAQMLTGQGGWPLTIVMTPQQQPFFAATYIPKSARLGRPGMLELVPRLAALWQEQRGRLLESAGEIVALLGRASELETGSTTLDTTILDLAYRQLAQGFDARHGGFGRAPKFPSPHTLLFLLRYWDRTGQREALEMVRATLVAMRHGGIFDQIGFGFHRYSTDPRWLVPHFEKMLYDQAMLVMAYAEAYQATADELFGRTVREACTYVLRDLVSPDGAFYSAEDADSEGEEGKFYLWTRDELLRVLPPDEAELVVDVFGVEENGNFLEEASRQRTGANILHLRRRLVPDSTEALLLEQARRRLFASREHRVRPQRDGKVLADWNGLMVAALAIGARALNDRDLARAAARAAQFAWTRMVYDGDRLHHRFADDTADIPGYLDDYAFVAWGFLELYQTVFEADYLQRAAALTDAAVRHFWDAERGGFFFTADDGEPLLVRRRETYDGAIPAGNSVMLSLLLRIGRLTGRPDYDERAHQLLDALSREVAAQPLAHTQVLVGLDFALGPTQEIVLVTGKDDEEDGMMRRLRGAFLPRAVIHRKRKDREDALARLAPYTADLSAVDGKATGYVCHDFQCELPVTDPDDLLAQLGVVTPESDPDAD